MIYGLRARGRQCVFHKAKRWRCNFLWTDIRSFPLEGVVDKGTRRRHAEWISALEVQGVRALVPLCWARMTSVPDLCSHYQWFCGVMDLRASSHVCLRLQSNENYKAGNKSL